MKSIGILKRTLSAPKNNPHQLTVNRIPIFTEITCTTILVSIGPLLTDNYLWYFLAFIAFFVVATQMMLRIASVDKFLKRRGTTSQKSTTPRKRLLKLDVNKNLSSVFGGKIKSEQQHGLKERSKRKRVISLRNRYKYVVETHV